MFTNNIYCQQHDNVWLFGFDSNTSNMIWGGSVMNFSTEPPELFYEFRDMNPGYQ